MKNTCIVFISTLIVLASISTTLHADIAPMPNKTSPYFSMTTEAVDISIQKDTVEVVANFKLVAQKDVPELQYCRVSEIKLKRECGEPYYEFTFSYPVLKGQKFLDFTAKVNGKEAEPQYSELGAEDRPKIENVERWLDWRTERIDANTLKKPIELNVSIKYKEKLEFIKGNARVTYVLKSGALWMGKIGEAKITLNSEYKIKNLSIKPEESGKKTASWTIKNFEPTEDLVIEVKKGILSGIF